MSAERPCRVCNCELTPENRAKVSGYICLGCERVAQAARQAKRNRASSGRTCSECSAPISTAGKSGLCQRCSARRSGRRDRGPSIALEPVEPHPCSRCGLPTAREVCRDCRDVLRTMGELHLWVDGLVAA